MVSSDLFLVGLILLAPALGGATRLWEQAVVILGCGLLIASSILIPQRRRQTHGQNDVSTPEPEPQTGAGRFWARPELPLLPLLCLTPLVCAAFLPASWFPIPPWRQTLAGDFQISLPATLSPQPWLSFENGLLLLAGTIWAAWLCRRRWTLRRPVLLSAYCAGLLALITVDLVLTLSGYSFALWQPQAGGFGFFPNRNQTGNLIGVGSICILALAFYAFRRRSKAGYLWALGYVICLVALVINFSRAGVLIFFFGSVAWLLWATLSSRRKRSLGLGLSAVLILLTGFFLFGGQTLERFFGGPDRPPDSLFGRLLMHADAWRLLEQVSWHGIGLGNFPPVFAHYRTASAAPNRAIHPESDWLWLGAEAGWFAPLLIFMAVGLWLWRCWPRRGDTQFYLRAALVVGALAFLAHGFMDVSAHRMGTVWPMIFLLSLLRFDGPDERSARRSSQRSGAAPSPDVAAPELESGPLAAQPPTNVVVKTYRRSLNTTGSHMLRSALCLLAALFCMGIGSLWLLAATGTTLFPNSASLDRLRKDLVHAQNSHGYDYTIYLATQGLKFVPLDWQLYFYRALARTAISTNMDEAGLDFARARFLEPNMVEVPFLEGRAWLAHDPKQSIVPWSEALRRAGTNAPGLYAEILREAAPHPEIRNDLRAFALDDVALLVVFLRQATPQEIAIETERLLTEDPSLGRLNPAQRREIFAFWARYGNQRELLDKFEQHPDWIESGWLAYAHVLAANGQFQKASELARRYVSPPPLPVIDRKPTISELQRRLLISTNDYVAGYTLYQCLLAGADSSDALDVLRKLTPQPDCPRYFWFLRATLEMRHAKWENAWAAWNQYLSQ